MRQKEKKGRTLKAAYNVWGTLTFDPEEDDIEQVILKVEELAKKLGYNEDTEVMAVRRVLPRDVYGICMTHKNLKDLKNFLDRTILKFKDERSCTRNTQCNWRSKCVFHWTAYGAQCG